MASWDNSAFYSKVADLEKNDPEVRELSNKLAAAVETGKGSDRLNAKFNALVEKKLGRWPTGTSSPQATGGWARRSRPATPTARRNQMANMKQLEEDFWSNEDGTLVISLEDGRYYVRDEDGERANLSTLEKALQLTGWV